MHFKKGKIYPKMLVPKNVQYCTLNCERRILRILNPVTPSLFMNVCMKIFLKAWNHKAKDLIWNVICFFFFLFLCMTCYLQLHNTRLASLFLCVFLSFFGCKFGKQIFRSLNSLFRNKQCINKNFL